MLLAIDIGNTNIKAVIFSQSEIADHFIAPSFDEIIKSINQREITEAAISSVVPDKTKAAIKKIKSTFGCDPFIINRNARFNIKIKYNSPETLGIDRVCSMEGAYQLNKNKLEKGSYLITIDMGTATTVNIVKYPNDFIGGLIAPGVNTMFKALDQQTSQLPGLTVDNYKSFIGDDTNSSIASGVVNSSVGIIEKAINSISKLDDCKKVFTYITGGMAESIIEYLSTEVIYDKFLVTRGIKSVHDLNRE
ncbi:MAG: type III pantothenate kinase [Ignavibacterium sp.]|nr:MAG: type III pantothenate kinase [Ignavibacterium sp.]